uniref:rRNA adenine N(6)-methyltransferase n=1 Tax=Zea mays TaxID=4577 RepID=A0A804QGF2_MAIZE
MEARHRTALGDLAAEVEPELDQSMEAYPEVLVKFREELTRPLHGRLCSSSASEVWDGSFFRLQKRWGQHLLTNLCVLDAIVRHATIRLGDAVLEVGPGPDNLTVRLLASPVDSVAAIEIHPRMATAVAVRARDLGLAHKLTVLPARPPTP